MNKRWKKTTGNHGTMVNIIKDNFSWLKDLAIVSGMAALLYLNGHYVTIDKFDAYQKANDTAHIGIQVILTSVDKTLSLMGRNTEQLMANEKEIRVHDIKIAELDGRLKNIEIMNIDGFKNESAINRAQLDIRLKTLELQHLPKSN